MKSSIQGLPSAKNLLLAAALALSATPVLAAVIILPTDLGNEAFDTNNFATAVSDSSCSSTCLTFGPGGNASVLFGPFSTAAITPFLIGSDISNGVGLGAGDQGIADFVIPAFGSLASIANGAGADFVIWEAGTPSEPVLVSVSLGGGVFSAPLSYDTSPVSPADSASGFVTNSVHINLDDFGIADGGLIDQVKIVGQDTGVGFAGPDVLAVAALNAGPPTVPEPGSVALLGIGLAALAFARRKQKNRG